MRLKTTYKAVLYGIISFIILCIIIYLIAWKSPEYYIPSIILDTSRDSVIPFMNYNNIIDHPRPYIISLKDKYTIFGATHTRDPDNADIQLIEAEWQKLKPTVALVEGRLGFLIPGIMNPVKFLGEGGKVKCLAEKDNIPLYNWDLSKEILAKQLNKTFNSEQIAVAQILNPYFSQLRFNKPGSPGRFIKPYLKRASFSGQENNIKNIDDINRIWKKYFPEGKDWKDIDDSEGLPGFLEDIAVYTNDLRNQQLVAVIKELTGKGEKVFVVCGSSHAACISVAF